MIAGLTRRAWTRPLLALLTLVMSGAAAAQGGYALSVESGELALPGGLSFGAVKVDCAALAVEQDGLVCGAGRLTIGTSPLGPLQAPMTARIGPGVDRYSVKTPRFALAGGRASFTLEASGATRHLRASLSGVALPAIMKTASTVRPALAAFELTAGVMDLDLDCTLSAGLAPDCHAKGRVRRLDLAGASSAEAATLRFDLQQRRAAAGLAWTGELALEEGAVYLEPGFSVGGVAPGFLLRATDDPLLVEFAAEQAADGRLTLTRARLHHPGVAELQFDGFATYAPTPSWRNSTLKFVAADVSRFYATWLQPLLLGSSLGGLTTSGALDLTLHMGEERIEELNLVCRACNLDDEQQRFAVYGINGGMHLQDGAEPVASTLRWDGASVYRIALGAGHVDWRSARGAVQAVGWQDVAIFDGALHFDAMELTDLGSSRAKLVLAGRVDPITLSSLTASFGWPPLAGQVKGTIPRLTISRRRIAVEGDLEIGVFKGKLLLHDLRITDFISAVPRLRTEVMARDLDLGELTSTFSFGNIEGHLNGEIRALRLEAWQPVSFDAYFSTPADDELAHRISRQAVNNLSKLGAGTGGPLASGWLSLIPSYSYGELGLGCRLEAGICHLRGVAPADNGGFYLLTRGGWLPPWIDIRGAGEQISWQTLLDGLRQIAQGNVEYEINVGNRDAAPKEKPQ